MENTTTDVRMDVKEKMKNFGNKGETYSDIILKLIEIARERQLQSLLMGERDTVPIEDALSNAKKRWRK